MKNQRDAYVDVAKGIAMLLVVRIHTEVFGVINAPYPIIAVPLFFFLSGFYDNTYKPVNEWLPKTFKSLFVTGVIWVFLSFGYVSLLRYIKDGTLSVNFSLTKPLIGGGVTWFLFALFYAKCCVSMLNKSKLPKSISFMLLLFVGAAASKTNLPLLFDEGLAATPFYYLGKLCYPYINKERNSDKWLAVGGLVCLLLMPCRWFPWVMVPYDSNLPVVMYPLCFFMVVLSFAPVLWIAKKLTTQKWLSEYGRQTLGILVLHPLMLHTIAVTLNRLLTPGSWCWIILFLCSYVFVCVVCYYSSLWILKYCPILLGREKRKNTTYDSTASQ